MKLMQISILSAVLTALRMVTGIIVSKFIAVYAGPTGLFMLGQLQSFVVGLNGLISNQIGQGVVRFSAENKENGYDACQPWWSAATSLLLITISVSFFIVTIFSQLISAWLFNNQSFFWIVLVVGFFLPFNCVNSIMMSALNGLGENKKNILGGAQSVLIMTILSLSMLYLFGLTGGLLAVAANNGIAGVFIFLKFYREPWVKIKYWFGSVDKNKKKILYGYMAMGIVGALTGPMALILIRNLISDTYSSDVAGLWQAVSRLSDAYILLIVSGVGMYYFPLAASISNSVSLKRETFKVISLLMPVLLASIFFVYFFRSFLIMVLYSNDFQAAESLIAPQLVGDFFRVLSFVPASILLAKGYIKVNIVAEIVMNLYLVGFVYCFIKGLGVVSANYAYASGYFIYFIFSCIFFLYHCRQLNKINGVN
nr:O-antigen translocase [uncultured Deefgea sp.]